MKKLAAAERRRRVTSTVKAKASCAVRNAYGGARFWRWHVQSPVLQTVERQALWWWVS